jgi:uncharacterized membrane protein YhaH (DUF805 family)
MNHTGNHAGAVNFALHKIRSKNHPVVIADLLIRMGHTNEQVSAILLEAGSKIDRLDQEIAEANDFLPPLNEFSKDFFQNKNIEILNSINVVPNDEEVYVFPQYPAPSIVVVKKLSLPRHHFIFKLFHSLSIAVLGIILGYVAIKTIEPSHSFAEQLHPAYWAERLNSPSVVLLVTMIFGFIIYTLHLFVRRLHDAGFNPWLALLLLSPILPFVANLSEGDTFTLVLMSLIPAVTVFIFSLLTPTHKNRV